MEEQTIKKLASGPSRQITTWQTYDINGFAFCVNSKDKKSVAQNSGFVVMLQMKMVNILHIMGLFMKYGNQTTVSIFRFLSFDANGLKANEVSVQTTIGLELLTLVKQVTRMTRGSLVTVLHRSSMHRTKALRTKRQESQSMWLSLGNNKLQELTVYLILRI